jgi:hypothetical protein
LTIATENLPTIDGVTSAKPLPRKTIEIEDSKKTTSPDTKACFGTLLINVGTPLLKFTASSTGATDLARRKPLTKLIALWLHAFTEKDL